MRIVRFGGLFGSISVGYRVLYLAPGVTDPDQGQGNVVSSSSGSLQMDADQSLVSLTLNISASAILEPSSSFYVNITEVMLTEGEMRLRVLIYLSSNVYSVFHQT